MGVRGRVPVERVVGRLLRRKGLTLSVAESCTGGLVGDRLTDVPGSSRYFAGGVIAYSDAAKTQLLGVSRRTLNVWGAVSEQTVSEMAAAACQRFATQVAISVSGIAGPGGGSRVKPVGLVYVCCRVTGRTIVEPRLFTGTRRKIKEKSATAALGLCRRMLEGEL
jgi:nicotinamide-nucleotide amidase